jgi:hypothetical protein
MDFCRETEGTGDPGKSSDEEKDPRQTVPDVEEGTTGTANKTP